jgi:hypothetical protein
MAITLFTTLGPILVKEMFEGYEAGVDIQRGPFINKKYLCPSWASAFAVVNALSGGGPRPVQHACPESPNLRCVSAVLRPRGEYDIRDSGRPQFNMPVIDATYAVPTWEALVTDDPTASQSFPNAAEPGQPYLFMEQSIKWGKEILKLPKRAYKFADGTVSDTPVHISIATAKFVLIRRWQETLPYGNVGAYMSTLNTSTFLGQPKGLILFDDAETRKQFQSDGTRSQEVAYTYLWRVVDHNMALRDDTGAFDLLINSSGGNPYSYTDLNAMLA